MQKHFNFRSRLLFLLVIAFVTGLLISYIFRGNFLSLEDIGPVYSNRSVPVFVQQDKLVKIILTGDIMLGRTVTIKSLEFKDAGYPFRKVYEGLSKADLVFANLENPIVANCPPHASGFTFCAPPEMLDGLVLAGVDVVTLANNHSRNYGEEGLKQTRSFLENRDIDATGLGDLVIKNIDYTSFGFLGFDFVDKNLSNEDVDLIKNSNLLVDILIVGVHWGEEYKPKANDKQRKIASELIANGADVVVGHHPHWVQDSEYINSKPVYYSLGNFVFDQMWSEETRKGMAVELSFKGSELLGETFSPVYMKEWAQPEWETSNRL